MLEKILFAGMHKGFTHSSKLLPFLADFFTVLRSYLTVVPVTFGNDLKKIGKFTDQFLGMGE